MTKPRGFPLVFLCTFSGYSPWFYPIVPYFFFTYLCSDFRNDFAVFWILILNAQRYGKDNKQHNCCEPSAQKAG